MMKDGSNRRIFTRNTKKPELILLRQLPANAHIGNTDRMFTMSKEKVLFFRRDDGQIVIGNASALAIRKAQTAFEGIAESLGNPTEDDIQSWVDEVRYGKG